MCIHAYRKPVAGRLLWWCFNCGQYFVPEKLEKNAVAPVKLPPVIWEITERLWKDIAPWPLMPFEIVKRYGWYISMLHSCQYLIMPIMRGKMPIFYSARLLDLRAVKDGYDAPKYDYPKGATKAYWISDEHFKGVVFFCEGVADAAYMSQLGTGVGLLGNFYDGSLDKRLKGKMKVLAMDMDIIGFLSAVRVSTVFNPFETKVLILPEGKDPTDIKLSTLRKMVQQLGVRL